MRTGEKNFWDIAFESECNALLIKTKQCYQEAAYKDAMKFGFFELQRVRDEYIVAVDEQKVHRDLIFWWIRIQALAVTPIAPHFAELIWKEILQEPSSIQNALFPEPSGPVNQAALDAVTYVKSLVTSMRQAELSFVKKKAKGKGAGGFDPAKPKGVRLFLAKDFPQWQTQCIASIREVYDPEKKELNNAKLKEILTSKGLLKDKRTMPFCVAFTVSSSMHDVYTHEKLC
jgi:leucyl-tRNA synthetase